MYSGEKPVTEEVDPAAEAPSAEAPVQELDASVTKTARYDISQVVGHSDWETGEFKHD
jgi:hypothetical protein